MDFLKNLAILVGYMTILPLILYYIHPYLIWLWVLSFFYFVIFEKFGGGIDKPPFDDSY